MMEMEQYRSEKLHEECGVFAVYDKSLEENMARREAAIQARKDAENKEEEGN